MKLVVAVLFVCAFLLNACADAGNGPSNLVIRDSAGIRIVENVAPTWAVDNAWRLGEAPELTIGSAEGDPNYELYRVRDALGMPDGRIVIANGGTRELRFYDADGVYLTNAGGEGEGPGEFQNISWISRCGGDSLVAYDFRLERLSIFENSGRFQRTVTVRSSRETIVRVAAVFDDCSFLGYGSLMVDSVGAYLEQQSLICFDGDGTPVDSVGSFPGREVFDHTLSRGLPMSGAPYFPRSTTYLTRAERFFVARNDTYEFGVYSKNGDLQSLIRRQFTNLPVTEEAIQIERERAVSIRTPHPMRPELEEFQDAKPIPATMPAYSSVQFDDTGNLWVEEYRYPGDEVARWTVFDNDGVMLGTIQMPPGVRLLHAGENLVIGRWQNELDVEFVSVYELIKP